MQKQAYVQTPEVPTNGAAFHHAVEMVQTGASKVATGTGKLVRRFPLTSVGVVLGAGVALGALGHRLLSPRVPLTLRERLTRRLSNLF